MVNKTGTQVYFDSDDNNDGDKAVLTGLAVAGRRAGKDGEINDYFSVNTTGAQIYFDDKETDGDKAVLTGLAVAGRRAGKDGETSDYLVVNKSGTQVYFDSDEGNDGDKAVLTGLAVAGRRAGKDGETSDYLLVNNAGTQVFFDDEDNAGDKAMVTGFAVAGRRAGKADADDYMTINTDSSEQRMALMRQMAMSGPRRNCINSMATRPPTVVRLLAPTSGMALLREITTASRRS